jgi:DNA-binding transcriptional MerR regulator
MGDRQFTSNEVMALTGITARQLQWWDERGLVVPARQGRNRLYTSDDLAEMAVLSQLRRKGFSLQRVRKIMRFLQRELGKRLVETVTDGSEYHLLTDGNRIYLESSAHEIVDILKNARQPIMSICVSDAVREIHSEISAPVSDESTGTRRSPKSATPRVVAARSRRKAASGS